MKKSKDQNTKNVLFYILRSKGNLIVIRIKKIKT